MRLQFLRGRGLSPKSLRERAERAVKRKRISRDRLKRFVDDVDSRPRVSWPLEAPRSISLVVPCFKHAAYLSEMLESVVAQTRLPDEVIFVDDCSPDDTGRVVGAFISTRPRPAGGRCVLLVNDRNLGQAASLNRGIAAASSELIMILNDDDYLMHDAVESMLAFFGQHRDVALVGAGHVRFTGRDALAAASKLSTDHAPRGAGLVVHRPDDVASYRFAHELDMTHSGQTFYKAAWGAVGGYWTDKKRRVVPFSDRDFQIRVGAIWPVAVVDTPLAFWRSDSSVDAGLHS